MFVLHFQYKFLQMITDSSWFKRAYIIHRDLDLPMIVDFIQDVSTKYYNSIKDHRNLRINFYATRAIYAVI